MLIGWVENTPRAGTVGAIPDRMQAAYILALRKIEEQRPMSVGALGYVFWRKTMGTPKPASDPTLVQLQQAINRILDRLGYFGITTDGVLGPGTCGAITKLGDLKNVDQVTAAEWASLVGIEGTGSCEGFTMPTRKGTSTPEPFTSKLDPAELALPWLTPDDRTSQVQADINVQLVALDYNPISVSGMLDAATCGAMRELDQKHGHTWEQAFGLQCKVFTPPTKRVVPSTTTCAEGFILDAGGRCVPRPSAPCPDGQIKDPTSGQCVSATPTAAKAGKKKSNAGIFILGGAALIGIFLAAKGGAGGLPV